MAASGQKTAGGSTSNSGAEKLVVAPRFVPTPERVSQYLERNAAEVTAQLSSLEGGEEVYQDLIKHQEDLEKLYPKFHPEDLRRELDLVGEALAQKEIFLKDIQSPEKKIFLRRAWDRVKGFAKAHPIITTLLAVALFAGGVAGALHLSGALQLQQAGVAVETIKEFLQGADVVNSGIGDMGGLNSLEGVPLGK